MAVLRYRANLFATLRVMQGPGAILTHTPDIVALGLDRGSGRPYTCIEVKTFDPSGPTHLATHHTATTRLGAHAAAVLVNRLSIPLLYSYVKTR